MTKNTTLKLSGYSAIAGAFILLTTKAEAQVNLINYTDIDPDISLGSEDSDFELDVNNDGFTDFTLKAISSAYSLTYSGLDIVVDIKQTTATPLEGNFIGGSIYATSSGGGFPQPYALGTGDSINAEMNWQSPADQALGINVSVSLAGYGTLYALEYGAFVDGEDHFMALKFNADGDTHFGWVRLAINEGGVSYTVKDYAYQSIVETGLEAGQQILLDIKTGIDAKLVSIYAHQNAVLIQTNGLKADNAQVKIVNTLGQEVYANTLDLSGMIIQLTTASDGIYIVQIVADGASLSQQVYITQ